MPVKQPCFFVKHIIVWLAFTTLLKVSPFDAFKPEGISIDIINALFFKLFVHLIASKIEPLGSLDKPIPKIESIMIDPLLTIFLSGTFFLF